MDTAGNTVGRAWQPRGRHFGNQGEKERKSNKILKDGICFPLLVMKCVAVVFVDIPVSGPAASHRFLRHRDRQSRILSHEEEDLNQPNLKLNFGGLQLNY